MAWSAAAAAGTHLVAVQLGLQAADLLLLLLARCFALAPPLPALGAVHTQLQLRQLPLDLPRAAVRPGLLRVALVSMFGMALPTDPAQVLHAAVPASSP